MLEREGMKRDIEHKTYPLGRAFMLEVGVKASSAQTHPESALSRSKGQPFEQNMPFEA